MGALQSFSIAAGTVNPTIWAVSAFVGWMIFCYPGASVPIGLTLGFLMILLTSIVYSLFSVVIPRTGGEYVTVSRAVHPAVGFMASWALWVYVMLVNCTCFTFVEWTLCTSPFLAMLGHRTNNPMLLSWAHALTDPNVVFVMALITIFLTGLLMYFGTKTVTRFFIVMWILMTAGVIIQFVLFATHTPADFAKAFGPYVGGISSYDEIMSTAVAQGWSPETYKAPVWGASLLSMGLCMFLFNGFGYAVDCAGEIKNVRRNIPLATAIGLAIVYIVDLIGMTIAPMSLGYDFIYASQYLSSLGLWNLPAPPFITYFAGALTDNIVLIFIMGLSLAIANLIPIIGMWYVNTRILFAWSFDRIIPESLADVSPRFHTPTKAIIATGIISTIGCFLVEYTPYAFACLNTAAGTATVWFLACLAATIIPYAKATKALYEKSPLKPEIGGVPVMSIIAVITLPILAWGIYAAMSTPAIGPTGPMAVAILVGVYVSGLIVYYIAKAIRKSQGIDIDLAYKEIPPL